MAFIFIDNLEESGALEDSLREAEKLALDCEAAGFHRYSDRLCLLQLSTPTQDFIIDTLGFDPSGLLRPTLEDPRREVVVHGADYDIRLLDRDLGIHLGKLFDTQAAAALVGEPSLGLAALLERHLGVTLTKKYQRADWAARPLSAEMLEYAASDTRHLLPLAELLRQELEDKGRRSWAEEEFSRLAGLRWEEAPDEDPAARVRGSRDLQPRELQALREALAWRDEIARERDRAPFRIAGDSPLLEAVRTRPRTLNELSRIRGLNPRLVESEGQDLLTRFDRVAALGVSEIQPLQRRTSDGRGRPPPEVEALAEKLKAVRNRKAEELGLDRGTLMSNSVLTEVAWEHPRTLGALRSVDGMKAWQAEVMGSELLEELTR